MKLEWNALSNAQYIRREMVEVKPYLSQFLTMSLKKTFVISDRYKRQAICDIQVCHQMKNKERIIIKFKGRKQRNEIVLKRKELKSKAAELRALQFGQSLFINDNKYFENQVLFYKCRKLKNLGRLSDVWFFVNSLSITIEENGTISKFITSLILTNC